MRPLTVARESRLSKFSDVPHSKKRGLTSRSGCSGVWPHPPDISPAVAAYYENLMKQKAESAAWKEKYLEQYMLNPSWLGSKEFSHFCGPERAAVQDPPD